MANPLHRIFRPFRAGINTKHCHDISAQLDDWKLSLSIPTTEHSTPGKHHTDIHLNSDWFDAHAQPCHQPYEVIPLSPDQLWPYYPSKPRQVLGSQNDTFSLDEFSLPTTSLLGRQSVSVWVKRCYTQPRPEGWNVSQLAIPEHLQIDPEAPPEPEKMNQLDRYLRKQLVEFRPKTTFNALNLTELGDYLCKEIEHAHHIYTQHQRNKFKEEHPNLDDAQREAMLKQQQDEHWHHKPTPSVERTHVNQRDWLLLMDSHTQLHFHHRMYALPLNDSYVLCVSFVHDAAIPGEYAHWKSHAIKMEQHVMKTIQLENTKDTMGLSAL